MFKKTALFLGEGFPKEDAPKLVGLCSWSLTAHLEENGRSMQFGDGNDHKPLWQTLMMLMVIMIIFRVPLIAVSIEP